MVSSTPTLRSVLASAVQHEHLVVEIASATRLLLNGSALVVHALLSVRLVGIGTTPTIDAHGASRLFDVHAQGRLHLENVGLCGGRLYGSSGAAILQAAGSHVELVATHITDCHATSATASLAGGAIHVGAGATLSLSSCTVAQVSALHRAPRVLSPAVRSASPQVLPRRSLTRRFVTRASKPSLAARLAVVRSASTRAPLPPSLV
jgi:hypothetical protein